MIDIKALTITGRTAIKAGEGFNIDRSKYMNASEAGTCIRKQWYSKRPDKFKPEEQDWGFAWRGSHGEIYQVESLVAANVPLVFALENQFSIADDETKIAATPDGVIAYDDEWIVPEFKTIDPRTNRRNLPREHHVLQLKIAMKLVDQHYDNPGIKKGLLIYMDASNFNDIVQFEVDFDDDILKANAKRAQRILKARNPDTLDREGKKTGDCKYCPYTEACGVAESDASGSGRGYRGSALDGAVQLHVEIKEEIDKQTARRKAIGETIKQELLKRKTDKITVGDITATLSTVKGRTSLDKAAVKKAGIDLSPFEKVGAASERLLVQRESE
jgi:CRISPR/Cas system-associated exonuclease Cas4 (RecB family)|tara:strand:+ start:30132 stop:31121 length:990 start_codon:yes stop_codon:yes gene_type:complete